MLRARVITALMLVATLAILLFLASPEVVALAFSIVAALAAWEWAGFMRQEEFGRRLYGLATLFACGAVLLWHELFFPWLFGISAAFWLILVPFWLYFRWRLPAQAVPAFLLGWLLILPTWAALIRLQAISSWLLLAVMAVVWVADIGAYFAGRSLGKNKLAPQISPGKTWEGVAGGIAGVLLYGLVVAKASPLLESFSLSFPLLLTLLLLLAGLSVIGDLLESLLKRHAQIKDSSQLLPGHGGILDRIDSLTSTLPFVALLIGSWHR
jgi:phosphatidate cytidylyltransferase